MLAGSVRARGLLRITPHDPVPDEVSELEPKSVREAASERERIVEERFHPLWPGKEAGNFADMPEEMLDFVHDRRNAFG
jgi:hypothetical protein